MTLADMKRVLRDFMRGGYVGRPRAFWMMFRHRLRDLLNRVTFKGERERLYWAIRDLTDEIKRLRESIDYDRRLK